MAEVNVQALKEALDAKTTARLKMYLGICARCGLCADTCHFFLAHDRDVKYVPARRIKVLLDLIKRVKKNDVTTDYLEELSQVAFGDCTMCRRCSLYCPFGIDIASVTAFLRGLCSGQGYMPEAFKTIIESYHEFGNQMSVSDEDWVDTLEWMEEELQEELPGFKMPIDKKGAKIMYTVNAREPKFYPMDIQLAAKMFYLAGEDWTFPSKPGWDDTNIAMFAADLKTAAHVNQLVKDRAIELGVKQVAMTECGHAFRANKYESPAWLGEPHPYEVVHAVELYAKYIEQGRIKIKEKFFDEVATYQDPCNVSRNGGLAEAGRYLMNKLFKNFVDMNPNGNYNFCCNGGGGMIPAGPPFRERRIAGGKVKAEQIRATGAKIVVTPCHNCYDQVGDLRKAYDLDYKVIQFKELLDECLIIPDELKAEDA